MTQEELKQRALSLVEIPEHYELEIEDVMENEDTQGEGEALFAWSDPMTDEGIMIKLNQYGSLIDLTIDQEGEEGFSHPLSLIERQKRAEQFLTIHYPDALKVFTRMETSERKGAVRFTYEQEVMDMPLPHSGCSVTVSDNGEIIGFTYHGEKPVPEVPAELASKESLRQQIADKLDLELQIACLHEEIYEGGKGELRLVYELIPHYVSFRANDGQPQTGGSDEDEVYVAFDIPPQNDVSRDRSIEQLIGIDETQFEKLREVDMGDEIGIVWRDRRWNDDEENRSLEGFFLRRTEETVKAMVDKASGRLRSFMWFAKRKGGMALTREECWVRALSFLQTVLPGSHRYLGLQQRSEEESNDQREFFTFRVYARSVPVYLQYVRLAVNRTTGHVDHFTGMDVDPARLDEVPTAPEVDRETAKANYLQALDFKLVWQQDYDAEGDAYKLVYKPCHREKRKTIRFIDALSGEMICEK